MKKLNYLEDIGAPYRNKSLANLEEEAWKEIPGLEGLYEVSNYGRIKSLAREIHYQNGKVIRKKESILMAGVSPAPNHFTGDYTYQLGIPIHSNKKVHCFAIARLVYYCFVKPFDLQDHGIFIIQTDGNGLNCYYKNLEAVTATEKQKWIYGRRRNISCFTWLDMKAVIRRDIERRFQPVTQYDSNGIRISTFKSIKDASAATGIPRSNISAVVNEYWQRAGGFVWKRGLGEERIDLEGYFDQWKISYKQKRGKSIFQISKEGAIIRRFPSISDASCETRIPFSNISRAAKGELKTAGGYIWKLDVASQPVAIAEQSEERLPMVV